MSVSQCRFDSVLHKKEQIYFRHWTLDKSAEQTIVAEDFNGEAIALTLPLPWVIPISKLYLWVPLFKHTTSINHWICIKIHSSAMKQNSVEFRTDGRNRNGSGKIKHVGHKNMGLTLNQIIAQVNAFYLQPAFSSWQQWKQTSGQVAELDCPCVYHKLLVAKDILRMPRQELLYDAGLDNVPQIQRIDLCNFKCSELALKKAPGRKPKITPPQIIQEAKAYKWIGVLHFQNVDLDYFPTLDALYRSS